MADAWYGENETYGTLADFLTGEMLNDLWGNDPSWGMRPTYTNAVSEFVGENPLTNIFVDSRDILSQGGGPDLYDWLALGVSGIPGVSPALSAANKYVTRPIWQNIQAASQSRFNPRTDWRIAEGTRFVDGVEIPPTYVDSGYRHSLEGRIKERLGMLPEKKDMPTVTLQDAENLYDDILRDQKLIEALRSKGYDPSKTLDELSVAETPSVYQISSEEWKAMEPLLKNQWLQREGLTEGDMTIFHYLNEGRDEFQKSFALVKKHGDKQLIDSLSNTIRIHDDYVLNWPETPFIKVLKEGDGPTEKVVSNFKRIKRADKLTKEFVNMEKTGMKPSHVDATEWEKLTADLTTEETLNLAKRMTLKNSLKLIQ
tara:strand:+ start:29870 stop:30979 length:1110 start_codon:yes stop_codon:yes gene_type:complete